MFSKTSVNRWIFILISISIISLIVWNTFKLFNELKENERSKMQIWAAAQEEFNAQQDLEGDVSNLITTTLFANKTTPMILYVHRDSLYDARNIDEKKVETDDQKIAFTEQFKKEYKPIIITYEGEVYQTLYYGNSPIINKLKYYPAILILVLFLCFAVLYFFYKTSKSAEQNKLWAGMAKETAHQIGTPLSSLVGWTEILKSEDVNPDYIMEMEKDVDRLKTITERFSKVGSIPKLEKQDIVHVTKDAFDYLKRRSSKLVEFHISVPEKPIYVDLNPQLYGWVIENLVKNGIDAMKGKGAIDLEIIEKAKTVQILVSDTGKGIPKGKQKQVFKPGFTTKRRGWGLGLSLARRIIDEYHNGKIKVIKSNPGKGATMGISLKIVS